MKGIKLRDALRANGTKISLTYALYVTGLEWHVNVKLSHHVDNATDATARAVYNEIRSRST